MDDLHEEFERATHDVHTDVSAAYEASRKKGERRAFRRRLGVACAAIAIAIASTLFVASAFSGNPSLDSAAGAPRFAYIAGDDPSNMATLLLRVDLASGDVSTVQSLGAAELEVDYPDVAVATDAIYLGATLKDESQQLMVIDKLSGKIIGSDVTSDLPGTQVPTDYIFPLDVGGAFVYHTALSGPSTFTNSLDFFDVGRGQFLPWSVDLGTCGAAGFVYPVSSSQVAVYCQMQSRLHVLTLDNGDVKRDESVPLPQPDTNRIGLTDSVVAGSLSADMNTLFLATQDGGMFAIDMHTVQLVGSTRLPIGEGESVAAGGLAALGNGDVLVAGSAFDKDFDPYGITWIREIDHDGRESLWDYNLPESGRLFSANVDGAFVVLSGAADVLFASADNVKAPAPVTFPIPTSDLRTADLAIDQG